MTPQNYTHNWQHARDHAVDQGLQIIEVGWEQHVIIDLAQQIVYRYPPHAAAAAKLGDEVAVLSTIHQQNWEIELPVMIEHTTICTTYHYIPGHMLDGPTLQALSNTEINQIGTKLGAFLTQFHQLDRSIVDHKLTKQSSSLLDYYAKRIDRAANTKFYAPAQTALNEVLAVYDPLAAVVVHGDLHGLNILVDYQNGQRGSGRLTGVIDLSEIEVGDRHQDLRKLFMTDSRLIGPAIEGYAASGGVKLNEKTIKAWAYVNEWANLCHFAEQPHNATYRRAWQHLTTWQQL